MEEWRQLSDMATENAHAQKPLELILARNLLTSLSTPAFLLDGDARLLFYNEAAGALLGMSFEDAGRMAPEEWTATFGPFDQAANPIPIDQMRITESLRDRRPAHDRFKIRSTKGTEYAIEASALPIVASDEGLSGTMIFFWPLEEGSE